MQLRHRHDLGYRSASCLQASSQLHLRCHGCIPVCNACVPPKPCLFHCNFKGINAGALEVTKRPGVDQPGDLQFAALVTGSCQGAKSQVSWQKHKQPWSLETTLHSQRNMMMSMHRFARRAPSGTNMLRQGACVSRASGLHTPATNRAS